MVSGVEELVAKAERHCTAMQVRLPVQSNPKYGQSHILESVSGVTTQANGGNNVNAFASQLIRKFHEAHS